MKKKVIIAIDYNPVSEKVIQEGYQLANLMDAEVCLFHVVTDIGYYQESYPSFIGYEGYSLTPAINPVDEVRSRGEDFLEAAIKHLNDPGVTTKMAEGDTASEILNFAEQWPADLIVMGTHSHSALEKLLMGTVASKVIERTSIPVYLVPVKHD